MNEETKSPEQSLPMTIPEQSKKVPPKGTSERRQYDRTAKQRSRSKAKQLGPQTPTADEWRDQFPKQYPAQQTELDRYATEFAESVLSELQVNSSHEIDACLDQVSRSLHGLKRGWLREVQTPAGELVSGAYFPDALGTIVYDAHRYDLEASPTFSGAYRELLKILDKKYGHEQTKDTRAIKAELDGTYALPPEPEIPRAPEPPAPEPPKLPTDAEVRATILARSRIELLESLQDQLSLDARQYLFGGVR